MTAARTHCPHCRRAVATLPANPWRPFCSERCRLLDLGSWLSERHVIAGEEALPDRADNEPADGEPQ